MKNPRGKHLADLALSDSITHGAVACSIAQVMIGARHNARFTHGFQHFVGITNRQCQRLFAQNMLACFGGSNRLIAVQFIGSGDIDSVDFRIGQQRIKACHRAGNPVLAGIGFATLSIGAVNGHNFADN